MEISIGKDIIIEYNEDANYYDIQIKKDVKCMFTFEGEGINPIGKYLHVSKKNIIENELKRIKKEYKNS